MLLPQGNILAQTGNPTSQVDTGGSVVLNGVINAAAPHSTDLGRVETTTSLSQMTLVFKRTPAQHTALEQLLQEQQDPSSPNYHRWLTPEEFADLFAPSVADINRITTWLQSEGLTVKTIARGRSWLVFTGTVAQVQNCFHTEIHRYKAGQRLHFGPAASPTIPAGFESLIAGIRGLDDFYLTPPNQFQPMYTAADRSHALAPGDVAHIYNFATLFLSGNAGRGQKIAVVGQSAIDLADIRLFRSTFQLPPNDPQTLLVGDDPGVDATGALQEADADLEWVGAVAPYAIITYAYATDVRVAAQSAIDQNLAPILVLTYGTCEANVSQSEATFIRDLAQQANAQGITWIASSGDSGAAACDHGSYPASHGLAVSFPASLPEITAVGGTEFNEDPNVWSSVNSPDFSSVFGYLPEIAWNDSSPLTGLGASGGGASILYSKPSWQNAPGVPDNNARNVPDLALSASAAHDPYLVISGQKPYAVGGTSLSAPVFAGMLALAAQALTGRSVTSSGFGNINPTLYSLANSDVAHVFHDVTAGDNLVPCVDGTPDCTNGFLGYRASPGYDLVTGLGSIDAFAFSFWFRLATVTTLSVSASQVQESTPVTFTAKVREYNGNPPLGLVYFEDGNSSSPLRTAGLDPSGQAVITLTLPAGPHSIRARYSNNASTTPGPSARFMGSVSAPVEVVVIPPAPHAPVLVSPANTAANVSISASLAWNPAASFASYDVYFGTSSPPPFWGSVPGTQCSPSGVAPNTTYFWKVVAKNIAGTSESPVWSFSTHDQTIYRFSRIAGTGQEGFSGDGGPAREAQITSPFDLALDSMGNLYIADTHNFRIRLITPGGMISTVAGTGVVGYSGDGGPAINANLTAGGIAIDHQGNIYISSSTRIRKISPDGIISTVVGNGSPGSTGDGGPAIEAEVNNPNGLAVDSEDNLYIADTNNNCIRKVVAGTISTIAGQCGAYCNGIVAGDNGPARSATLCRPEGVAVDRAGSVSIADTGNFVIRKVSNGIITPVAGYGTGGDGPALTARIFAPNRLTTDSSGNLYFTTFNRIQKITNGMLTTLAGGGFLVPADGMAGISAQAGAGGIAVDPAGKIYLAGDPVWALLRSDAPSPSVNSNGVYNAASLVAGPVAPGSIATIRGSFALNAPDQNAATPLPTILSGLSIQIQSPSSISVPLFYASAEQVNVQIPWELSEQSSVPIQAVLNRDAGPAQALQLAPFSPGIFTVGANQGAIIDSLGRLVGSTNPTTGGSVITIYCTGLGAVKNPPATGSPASGTTVSATINPPTATIGGIEAPVLFSGLAPGTVGEYQINVQVPTGVRAGSAIPVVISIGGLMSNSANISVR